MIKSKGHTIQWPKVKDTIQWPKNNNNDIQNTTQKAKD